MVPAAGNILHKAVPMQSGMADHSFQQSLTQTVKSESLRREKQCSRQGLSKRAVYFSQLVESCLLWRTLQGRVRTKTVKKASRQIIEKYYNRLTLDFHTNKRVAEEVAVIQSKRLRNKIAGFTTVSFSEALVVYSSCIRPDLKCTITPDSESCATLSFCDFHSIWQSVNAGR